MQHCALSLSTVLRQLIPILLSVQSEAQYSQSKHNLFIIRNQLYFQLIYIHHQADYKNKTVYTELPATGTCLAMQLLKSELCYIHYLGTDTEQQNIPIRIRCSQWRVRDTIIWLSRTSAASSTITVNRITKHINKDQVCTVVSQRYDNVALHRTSGTNSTVTARARAHTHTQTHTHTTCGSFAYSCHKQMQHLRLARNIFNTT